MPTYMNSAVLESGTYYMIWTLIGLKIDIVRFVEKSHYKNYREMFCISPILNMIILFRYRLIIVILQIMYFNLYTLNFHWNVLILLLKTTQNDSEMAWWRTREVLLTFRRIFLTGQLIPSMLFLYNHLFLFLPRHPKRKF